MPRELPVGNGNLLVNFDLDYRIRDIYYPHVGKANHANQCVSRTGVWIDGRLSWLSDSAWTKELRYVSGSLVTQVTATNHELALRIVFNDVVDFDRDIFLRRVEAFNLARTPREIRLFFHYAFRFWDVGRGDAIHYHPNERVLIAYKDDCYFLINASLDGGTGISGWTTGHWDEQGAWKDAEDGVLDRNSGSFGLVDGVVAVHKDQLSPGEPAVFYTWLAAAQDLKGVLFSDYIVGQAAPQYFITRTLDYWGAWANKEDVDFQDLPDEVVELYRQSLLILRTQVDNGGGIIAATDSDLATLAHGRETYSYVWPRDGGYIAHALDKAGFGCLAARFYDFCKDIIYYELEEGGRQTAHRTKAYMLHKYNPDRSPAANWMSQVDEKGNYSLPIQEDETSIIPYTLWYHYLKFRDVEILNPWFRPLGIHTGNFMVDFREPHTKLPAPSFDLWEDNRGIYSYTVATTWAGLLASAKFAELFGRHRDAERFRQAAAEIKEACETYLYDKKERRFLKKVLVDPDDGSVKPDYTVDASLYGLWYFGMFEPTDPRIERTMQAVTDRLWCQTPIGGLARYEGDRYHWDPDLEERREQIPGNPWVICTLWMAQYHIASARTLEDLQQAVPLLQWARERALPSGILAEQFHPITGQPLSVSPLTWSHAAFIAAVREYIEKYEVLQRQPRAQGGSMSVHSDHRGPSHRALTSKLIPVAKQLVAAA